MELHKIHKTHHPQRHLRLRYNPQRMERNREELEQIEIIPIHVISSCSRSIRSRA